ncbi:MAG: caspase family protein [Pyrinomonadaceae bacterium]|nr:caspase family protein [Pyrinomonadaceae bacterium]
MMRIINIAALLFVCLLGAISAQAEDRALVVGVDVYANPNLSPTDGATDDAKAMQKLLIEKFNFAPKSIKILLNEQATAANIVGNFQTWLVNGTRPGDRVFFFYAGHGFQVPDDNGDEEDKMDEVVTPYDIAIASEGGKVVLPNEKTFIRDDKFNDFIAQLSGRRAVLMFDSCHSGTLSRSLGENSKYLPSRYLRLKPSRNIGDGGYSSVPLRGQPRDLATIREDALDGSINGVVVLSAASPYQQAFPIATENNITRGAFSYIFENLIRGNESAKLEDLEKDLKREMKKLADKGQIGQSPTGEFQVPQIDILSKTKISDKPLFAETSPEESYAAAVESALFNPLSTMRVKLDLDKRRYKIGETINYSVDVGEAAHLYILVFSTQNKAFCIFPSAVAGDSINYVMKGKHGFPRENYVTEATEPVGKDVWVALVSKKKLNLGEKEEYTWDEVFKRIGLEELRKAIVGKTRGAGNKQTAQLTADDWQAATVVVETVEK